MTRDIRKLRKSRANVISIQRLKNRSYLHFCMSIDESTRGWWKHRHYYIGKYYFT
jgi:hypothetical protein